MYGTISVDAEMYSTPRRETDFPNNKSKQKYI